MTVRRILTVPDPLLRKKSALVDKVDKDIKNLMNDMLETMYDAPGIGLAAIQIGISKIIFLSTVFFRLSGISDESKDFKVSLKYSV